MISLVCISGKLENCFYFQLRTLGVNNIPRSIIPLQEIFNNTSRATPVWKKFLSILPEKTLDRETFKPLVSFLYL